MNTEDHAIAEQPDGARFRHLFENVQDAIVEFEFEDDEPIVRTVNDAFCDLFGATEGDVLDTPLNDLIVPSDLTTQSDRFDQRTAAGKSNYAIVDRRTESGIQTLLYRGIPYRSGERGFAIYTDLTDEIRQERELAVLNRVLRYNLSTEVDTLVDHAEQLLNEADDPGLVESARTIRESALALDRLSTEARDIEQVLAADPDLEPADLDEAIYTALDGLHLVERADVTIDIDDVPPVMSGGHLDRAIAALVDNAIRHADVPTPSVRLTARHTDERVAVTVSDDGPGLPEREQRILTGQLELTPLDHGSGLGLWLVRWIVTAYDGDVTYTPGEDGGSDITIELVPATES